MRLRLAQFKTNTLPMLKHLDDQGKLRVVRLRGPPVVVREMLKVKAVSRAWAKFPGKPGSRKKSNQGPMSNCQEHDLDNKNWSGKLTKIHWNWPKGWKAMAKMSTRGRELTHFGHLFPKSRFGWTLAHL